MLTLMKRQFRRRRLARTVAELPALLQRSYGGQDRYTAAQVRRSAERLAMTDDVLVYALAACCEETEFRSALGAGPQPDYRALRQELCELFDINRPDFTCRHMRKLRGTPRSSGWSAVGEGSADMLPPIDTSP